MEKTISFKTYLDFAEDDFGFLLKCYENNIEANALTSISQNACEKYMKHIIDTYYNPGNDLEMVHNKEDILRSHNLGVLMKFLKQNLGVSYSKNTDTLLKSINGYYFNTGYPGSDSFKVDFEDIELCVEAIKSCRKETFEIINSLDNKLK